MRRVILSLVFVAALSSASAYGGGDGGYAGAFLQVPVGARPTAMAAYLAVSNDGAAPLFNPAGLATLPRPLLSTSYRAMQLDRTLGYITAVFPVRGQSSLGVSWLYAGSGSVEVRDFDGYLEGRDFSMNNHQFSIVFAKRFERFLAFGTNLSYLMSTMPEFETSAVGFDFGLMLYVEQLIDRDKRDQLPVRNIQIGVTVKNISKTYRWDSGDYNLMYTSTEFGYEQEDKVPVEFGFGVSGRFLERKLLVAGDLLKNVEQDPFFRAGAEYFVTPEFALRGGHAAGRFTAGTGYLFHMSGRQLAIAYAFSTDKADEGSEHIFSFDLMF